LTPVGIVEKLKHRLLLYDTSNYFVSCFLCLSNGQVGLPADREQYIHRLGRTGRRGKEGQGILLLAPWEEFFLSTVKDLPIEKVPVVPSVDPDTKRKVLLLSGDIFLDQNLILDF